MHAAGLVLKNALGLLLLACGIVMLVIPGQGLLTMLIGLMLMDFPGKRRLEARLVAVPSVRRSINWLRERAHRAPLAAAPGGHERRGGSH